MSFTTEFKRIQRACYRNSSRKGFHDADARATTEEQKLALIGLKLALIHSELSEALEGWRKAIAADDHIPAYTGPEAELADAVIRILDLAEMNKLRLADAIVAKMVFNSKREKMHGGKKF